MNGRWLALVLVLAGCGGTATAVAPPPGPSAPPPAPDAESFRAKVPAPAPAGRFTIPAPEVTQLKNGLSVIVLRQPSQVVATTLVVRHAADAVPRGKSGLGALTLRLMAEETRNKNPLALAEAVEDLGTTLEHSAEREGISLRLTALRPDFARATSLLAEVALTPALAPRTFARVRAEWLDGLRAERQAPMRLATIAGSRLLFGDQLGAPVNGGVSDVERLAVGDVVDFHRAHVVPSASALIVVGDVEPEVALGEAQKAFGSWRAAPPRSASVATVPSPPVGTRVVLVDRPDSVQTAVFVGQPFPGRLAQGHEARELMSGTLGGLFTSRINHNLREEHAYTYGARSLLSTTRQHGAFVVLTEVEVDVTGPALSEIFAELSHARREKPLTNAEIDRARSDRISRAGARLERVERLADDLQQQFTTNLAHDYFSRLPATLRALGSEAVRAETARLDTARATVVLVGDAKRIRAQLGSRFRVETASGDLTE